MLLMVSNPKQRRRTHPTPWSPHDLDISLTFKLSSRFLIESGAFKFSHSFQLNIHRSKLSPVHSWGDKSRRPSRDVILTAQWHKSNCITTMPAASPQLSYFFYNPPNNSITHKPDQEKQSGDKRMYNPIMGTKD